MPAFDTEDMQVHQMAGTGFVFSAKQITTLGSSEYTLVCLACDVSGSVSPFATEMENSVKEIVRACQHSPRADNLMLRYLTFDDHVEEQHGFRPLSECDLDKYNGTVKRSGGMTALFDASVNAIRSVVQYGTDLAAQDYACNAIVFVVTDGDDNRSTMNRHAVAQAVEAALRQECGLESIRTVLVGVNVQSPAIASYLAGFKAEGGFDQYVELADAKANTLAKLAEFVSRSISSQSQSLGTGGPSQALTI